MVDNFWRRELKKIALACFQINVYGTRAIRRLRGEKPWKLGGACGRCAKCCESPGIQPARLWSLHPLLTKIFLGWHRHVNGFHLVERIHEHGAFLFRCTHLDEKTKLCDSYETRPGMCRDYPRAVLWEGRPTFLPGCGYRAIHHNSDKFTKALEKEGLEGEELENLRKKLNLE